MEALKLTATALDGKLTIAVPDLFNNQQVEVIVLMPPKEELRQGEALKELHHRRMEHFGKAPVPHFPISKYDVYNQ